MGAAGGGGQANSPPPNAPGAAAPAAPEPPATPQPAKSWFASAKDFIDSFANKALPALTRLSRPSGEKLAEVANAAQAAKSSWDYFSRILKVNGKVLAEMTPEEHRFIGAVWLERRMREYRDNLRRQGLNSSEVATLIGQEGSPLQTEADYQQGHEALWSFWEAVKQEWTREVDANYRGLMNLEPDEAINALSQIPGLPLNAIAVTEGETGPGVVKMHTPGTGFQNLRVRKPGFTKQAELSAPAYDIDVSHMMQRTLDLGIPAARRAEFVRKAIESNVIKDVSGGEAPPDGWKYLGLDPVKGLPGIDPKARYYAHPDAFRDIVQGLGIGDRPAQAVASGLRKVTDPLYSIALMSPVELASHIGNHFTALWNAGMGVPIANLKDSFANAWRVWHGEPEMMRKVMDLAKIGASFGHEAKPGLVESLLPQELGEKYGKFDPTHWINRFTSSFIDTMQKAVRVQLGDAYEKVVRTGQTEWSETGKRDFINQALGNYSAQANSRVTQFLKDSGLQGFATAAHTFTVSGVKKLVGASNLEAKTWGDAATVWTIGRLKLLPVLAMGPVINALLWKQAFPANVPPFAIKTREDDDKNHYFDPLAFTGLRRGARATGVNALVESAIRGDKTAGETLDKAKRDAILSLKHLFEGPPAQFIHTATTGEDFFGRKIAPQVSKATTENGIEKAKELGKPAPGSSQTVQDVKTAPLGVNPLIGTLAGSDRPKTPRTLAENIFRSLGPFGEKERDKPKEKAPAKPKKPASYFGRLY